MEIQTKWRTLPTKIFDATATNLRRTGMLNKKLEPCPFCGGKVTIAEMGNEEYGHYIVTRGIEDDKCACRVFMESGQFEKKDTEEYKEKVKANLIDKWNRRVCQCHKEN